MVKKHLITAAAISVVSLSLLGTASAYWVWTPETKKFINPKYAVKDSPKEQFDWAMTFYDAKDYERAAFEFDKLTKNYEYSEYAPKAQYYVGLCCESEGKYYLAFQNYQKAVDNFPHIDNIDEIIAREFNIGHIYSQKENPKVLGTDIMTSYDRAIEIYRKVVENAPFGKIADQAQFKMGETMKTAGRYEEATVVFQKFVEDYPNSPLIDKARYEVANCAYRASLQPAYDAAPTDKAIKAFEEFTEANKDTQLSKEADQTIQRLKDKAAEKSMMTAEFYERTGHNESAVVYYKDVLERFPDSTVAAVAKKRIDQIQTKQFSGERKSWIPWPGSGKKAEQKAEGAPGPQQAAEAPAAKEKGKGWMSGLFGKKEKKPAEPAAATPAPAGKAKAGKGWFPSIFGAKKAASTAPAAKAPAQAAQVETKKGWFPLALGGKKEAVKETRAPEAAQPAQAPAAAPAAAVVAAETPQIPDQPVSAPSVPAPSVPPEEKKTEEAAPQVATMPITVEEKPEEAPAASAAPVATPEPAAVPAPPATMPEPAIAPAVTAAPAATSAEEKKEEQAPTAPASLKVYFEEKPAEKAEEKPLEPVREPAKAGWVPFKFEESKGIPAKAAKAAVKPVKEPTGKGWFPFTLDRKEDTSKQQAAKAAEPKKEAVKPAQKSWFPLAFGAKEESRKAQAPVKAPEQPKAAQEGAAKSWFPLAFEKKETGAKEEPARKGFVPLSFENKAVPQKAAPQESLQLKDTVGKKAKKGWTPFSFGKKEAPSEERPESAQPPAKKGWAPLRFEKEETAGEGNAKNE